MNAFRIVQSCPGRESSLDIVAQPGGGTPLRRFADSTAIFEARTPMVRATQMHPSMRVAMLDAIEACP